MNLNAALPLIATGAILGAIVVFGRTLYAMIEEHDGVLFVNPGRTSFPANLRKLGTVAILDLQPGKRDVDLIELASV